MRKYFILISILYTSSLSGCSLFFGNIKPSEEKSSHYSVEELSKSTPGWRKLVGPTDGETSDFSRPDVSYESEKSAAVISMTSGCRSPGDAHSANSLTEQTRGLLFGIAKVNFESVSKIEIDHTDALWSKVTGELNGEPVKFEIIVTQKSNCFYDLVLVGRPPFSRQDQEVFAHFVSTFHFN